MSMADTMSYGLALEHFASFTSGVMRSLSVKPEGVDPFLRIGPTVPKRPRSPHLHATCAT